jgi:hypothetical protein
VRLDLCTRHQARHGGVSRVSDQNNGAAVLDSTNHIDLAGDTSPNFQNDAGTELNSHQPLTLEIGVTDSHQNITLDAGTEMLDWVQNEMSENRSGVTTTSPQPGNDSFATWLFNSPGSQQQNFDLSNYLPYVDFGLDYCSPTNDFWQFEPNQTTTNTSVENSLITIPVSNASCERPEDYGFNGHVRVSIRCRSRIVNSVNSFLEKKRPPRLREAVGEQDLLFSVDGMNLPNLTTKVLHDCLSSFWSCVAIQLPVIHQQTFSSEDCQLLLLLAMLMLGASQIVRSRPPGTRNHYRGFADLIAINLRWEIFPEAEPPITLWVAQALLLLEFYEKMFSSRRLHERAYIHHASTLALLRRGSPMVGHAEEEEPPTRCPSPGLTAQPPNGLSKQAGWWRRWARNESWHRVVFTALHMDTLHAVAFGHESSLLPYEIRLPLPCDDSIWSAQSPEDVWRLEETFSMHGISQQPFLDSLKRCLHGHEVHSNHGARIILGSGLLSVGWHIRRRERNQQFLESTPSAQEQERWRVLLLNAYTHWCQSFQKALEKSKAHSRKVDSIRDVVFNPSILYRLAFITSHVDILDAQVFAGSKRLLGRKITDKDYLGCSTRMRNWAATSSSKLAVAHAFQLLDETLLNSEVSTLGQAPNQPTATHYTCRTDASIYRPWVLYLAALTIWSYQYASSSRPPHIRPQGLDADPVSSQKVAHSYIRSCAASGADNTLGQMSVQGCGAMCKLLAQDFAHAEWELLLEASKILDSCATMILKRA